MRSTPNGLFATGVKLVVLASLLSGFWWLAGAETQRIWDPRDQVRLTLEDRYFRVPRSELGGLRADSEFWFRAQASMGQGVLRERMSEHLDRLFLRVENRIPSFLDWYYSLGGEYSRLGMSALNIIGLDDRNYVQEQASERLFEAVGWEQSLARLDRDLTRGLVRHDRRSREGWMARLVSQLSEHEVPAPIKPESRSSHRIEDTVSLDGLNRSLEADSLMSLNDRAFLSAGGGTLAGFAVWRGAFRGAAAVGGRRAAAKGAGRVITRAGSGAAGGAMICAPSGPVALGCALVAGTAAMLTIDWALLSVEEAVSRDAMEARLKEGLAGFRENLERDLGNRIETRVEHLQQARQERIRGVFLPMEGIKQAATGVAAN
ncbi:hypothetical protein DES49_2591 [Halospina denitrificans]|uniref:Uncharacterized protein n=1 Tax=Halospina denitrificans TaxID=332522 RepID=A0A4V3EPN7_9GAMM|nr:hypothetical protein [Halospina denitrificans]TDT38608.1 hypothetical protein DES49_2591 [Halospina denitrificans]